MFSYSKKNLQSYLTNVNHLTEEKNLMIYD